MHIVCIKVIETYYKVSEVFGLKSLNDNQIEVFIAHMITSHKILVLLIFSRFQNQWNSYIYGADFIFYKFTAQIFLD